MDSLWTEKVKTVQEACSSKILSELKTYLVFDLITAGSSKTWPLCCHHFTSSFANKLLEDGLP